MAGIGEAVMNVRISGVSALEVLDSRGRPTLEVIVTLGDGTRAVAGVPSGASTGTREAVERRDGDAARYGGAGVTAAVAAVNGEIAEALRASTWAGMGDIDDALIALDGTDTKSRLGANAIVGVSMAVARALARAAGQPLYRWLRPDDVDARLPAPHFNVVNGGAHAQNRLAFQEFMLAPLGAPGLPDAVRAGAEIYGRLRGLLRDRGLSTGLGDEGGFAPDLSDPREVLDLLVEAIEAGGYRAGIDGVAIALDPAASEFYADGAYRVTEGADALSGGDMVELYAELVDGYPIWSVEDGLAEDDWDGWRQLTERLGDRVQLVGDDIFVTDPVTIARAIADSVGNAALIKLNQIGTVSETLEAMRVCREAGYGQMVSHRSGETGDTFIADLAVATGCGQLKSGAPARGERVAKYNRLLRIAQEASMAYGPPAAGGG
jgi:enolase